MAAGSAIGLICNIVGYGTVLLGLLGLLRVNLGNLLVGGAVTGVVIGIAAQQTLGNFFAGLVLLFARPYVPGPAGQGPHRRDGRPVRGHDPRLPA